MAITICGNDYDLPEVLMLCPECRQAQLIWDGRSAWRCVNRQVRANGTIKIRCRHGLALSAIIDDLDLELKFTTSIVNLARLRLTEYGLKLAKMGAIQLPWLSPASIEDQLALLPTDPEEAAAERRDFVRLMVQNRMVDL